mmetsp:Transcript_35031/g.99295  ORF Transcript_35031/g.99295 Transcript_35031/m.99295 type:complete len:327 (-) Transcript_35031:177-1157(-)
MRASVAFAAGASASALISCAVVGGPRRILKHVRAMSNSAAEVPLPAPKKIKAALCQLSVTADKDTNIKSARSAIEEAASQGAQLVVLPEMWNCPYSNDSFPKYAEDFGSQDSPSTTMMSEVAKSLSITLVGGTVPERRGDKLYNTCCVFGTQGELLGRYSKTHLFDIDIPGKITFFESDTLTPGEAPLVVDTECGRLGIGICYDIRFPELAMLYAKRGAQVLVYPGAFNMTTGPLHWQLLAQARAVDNQIFMAVCSPARDESAGYVAWGHSSIIGPFAEILGTTEHSRAIVYADLDFAELGERRRNMPLQKQRRQDMYALLDKSQP